MPSFVGVAVAPCVILRIYILQSEAEAALAPDGNLVKDQLGRVTFDSVLRWIRERKQRQLEHLEFLGKARQPWRRRLAAWREVLLSSCYSCYAKMSVFAENRAARDKDVTGSRAGDSCGKRVNMYGVACSSDAFKRKTHEVKTQDEFVWHMANLPALLDKEKCAAAASVPITPCCTSF